MILRGWEQAITLAAMCLLFYLIDFVFIAAYAKRRTSQSWHLGYTLGVVAAMCLLCLQPVLWPVLGLRSEHPAIGAVQLAGLSVIGVSLALQIWARMYLRQYYAEGASVEPGHRVIATGPYALARHPLFVAYDLFVLGMLGIGLNAPLLLLVGYVFWDFHRAALADERLLCEKVPGYAAYMAGTPRYLPRLARGIARSPAPRWRRRRG